MPKTLKRCVAAPAVLIGLALTLVAPGAGAGETQTFEFSVVDGQVESDPGAIRVTQNDQVILRWQSDHETKIHLHGYDMKTVLAADGVTEMSFEAHATGRYPITSHGHHGDGHDEPVLIHVEVYPE